ncbi:MAG TPA: hypothetical protein PLT50_03365 [bacterium]|nr:hypothetical protein [bacterium]
MTLEELRNDVGSMINQYDDTTESFVPGFVTNGEVDRWINQAFEDVYKWYALANKGRFSSTATTDAIAGQAIYTLGGDAKDLLAIESVFVYLHPTDTKYTRAYPIEPNDYLLVGNEEVPSSAPRYMERQIFNSDEGHYQLAIEFPEDCIPKETIPEGIKIMYIERPPLMTDDSHIPEKLPRELHKLLVMGAAIPALRKMGEFQTANLFKNDLNSAIQSFYIQEQSVTSKGAKVIKMRRKDANRFYLRRS